LRSSTNLYINLRQLPAPIINRDRILYQKIIMITTCFKNSSVRRSWRRKLAFNEIAWRSQERVEIFTSDWLWVRPQCIHTYIHTYIHICFVAVPLLQQKQSKHPYFTLLPQHGTKQHKQSNICLGIQQGSTIS
jgi:hypothetical protein